MVHGVQRDPALHSRRLVAKPRGHPRVRALMKTERKKHQDELKDGNKKCTRLQTASPKNPKTKPSTPESGYRFERCTRRQVSM